MIQSWRIRKPRNLILLFPMRDATPMSTVGLAGIAIEAAILNDVIGHADPFMIIEQHFDAGGSDPVMRRMAIPVVAAARLSKTIH